MSFAEINQNFDCPFLIELYESQIFLKTCRVCYLQTVINKNKENKYVFFPIKHRDFHLRKNNPKASWHISLLIFNIENKSCFHMDVNGWSTKNWV